MRISTFCSEALPQAQREAGWQNALSGLAKATFQGSQSMRLKGRVWSRETPLGIKLALISASAQQLSFQLPGEADGIWVALLMDGHGTMTDSYRVLEVGPDDILHGVLRGKTRLQLEDPFRLLLARFPRTALNTRLPLAQEASRMNTENGMSRILGAILHAVAETVEDLPEEQERAIESMLREFVIVNLTESANIPTHGTLSGAEAVLLQKAYQIIDARLSEPDLSISQIARELGTSLRYLYKLFAGSGEGFSKYVKRRRLERCRCDLGNPIYAHLGVSEICFRWGFNEAAHFSRVFRAHFGMSPRTWRKSAADRRQGAEKRDSIRPAQTVMTANAGGMTEPLPSVRHI